MGRVVVVGQRSIFSGYLTRQSPTEYQVPPYIWTPYCCNMNTEAKSNCQLSDDGIITVCVELWLCNESAMSGMETPLR